MSKSVTPKPEMKESLLIFAWITTLLISSLPNIIWQEFFGPPGIWLLWSKLILLGLLLALSFFWKLARPLRSYFLLFLILFLAEEGMSQIANTRWWQIWFPFSAGFTISMFGNQLRRLVVSIIMLGALFLIYRQGQQFYFMPGQLDAPAGKEGPVIDEGTPWNKLGWILSLCITLGTLAFLWLNGRPSLQSLVAVLPMLPAILLLAAMNAFSEELSYRAAFLAPLVPVTGKRHAILLTAVTFGLAHFYGVPYGIIGVIMSFILGYLLSKSMVETRGFFWGWWIHFLQDVGIFTFIAIGAIIAGGG
jgi:membrane protease YdiL (CAAX protease family)